jgi:dihydropteroate synthase
VTAIHALLDRARRDGRALVMGVLNVTPDSFSDGGQFLADTSWKARIDGLLAEGADVIDVGGESTRPGSSAVSASEQLARVLGPVGYAAGRGAVVSIDTTSVEVARAALGAGASIVNDVSCLADLGLAAAARDAGAALIVMHSLGPMASMPGYSSYPDDAYTDVVADVRQALLDARARAEAAGLRREAVLLDPGLGFHKSAAQSYALLRHLGVLCADGPVAVGASRKSFLARDVASPPADRLGGTLAACLAAARAGATLLRVHDVLATRQALAVERAIAAPGDGAGVSLHHHPCGQAGEPRLPGGA